MARLDETMDESMTTPGPIIVGSYDYRVVVLSVLIAIMASFAALAVAGRVTAARGNARQGWLIGGATALGIGTCSMHYVGMLAFRLPVRVWYNWPTALLSFLPSFFASSLALLIVSRPKMGARRAWAGSVFTGGGIAAMHYTGMASMRLEAMCHYSPMLVTLSVLLAMAISLASLWLMFQLRDEVIGRRGRMMASALLLGAAISVMHYTGMASATFTHSEEFPDISHSVSISVLGSVGIGIVGLMVLVLVVTTSVLDRLQQQKSLLDELFEQAPEAVVLVNLDDQVIRLNREFTRLFGYAPLETLGLRLGDLISPDELRDEVRKHADLMAHGQRVDAEVVHQRKDGSRLEVSVIRVPVSLPGGKLLGYAIYRDITERKKAERELRHSREQLRALSSRLETLREAERIKISREIHDELGQKLTGLKLDLLWMERNLDELENLPAANAILDRVVGATEIVDGIVGTVQEIAAELRPSVLDKLGLGTALQFEARRFQDRTGIPCEVRVPQTELALSAEVSTAFFRVFQESLTNVARHAHATKVEAELKAEPGFIVLSLRDNGKGITEADIANPQSLGLLGMKERVAQLGGEVVFQSHPGQGTLVAVRVPTAAATPATGETV
jgi:PAS domain S-box-containing protein